MGDGCAVRTYDGDRDDGDVNIFFQILSGFKFLQYLELPLYGYSRASVSYDWWNSMDVKHEEENVSFATSAGKSCRSLKKVCFGNKLLVEMIRDDDGRLQDVDVEGRTEGNPNSR